MISRLLLCSFALLGSFALAFETLDDNSPIHEQVEHGHKDFVWGSGESTLVDGAVTSFPPDLTTFDRTLVSIARLGMNLKFTGAFALRFILDSRYKIRKQFEEFEPRRIVEEEWFDGRPSLDAVIFGAGGLEVFGGVGSMILPQHEKTTEAIDFEATTEYKDAALVLPRGGIIKRSNVVTGGISYIKGNNFERDVVMETTDGTYLETKDLIYFPTEIALFFRFKLSHFLTDAEFTAVQAGDVGPKTEEGNAILEDYTRLRLGFLFPWDPRNLNFYLSLVHKTLSYSDNVFMNLETIPMTTAHFKVINGSAEKHLFVGLTYGYARDKQSLPEFNAKYRIDAYGGKAGFNFLF